MDSYDTADSDEHPMLGRLIKLGLFLLVQGIAVMLVAFVALLVSLEPGWSATTEQASLLQPGDAKSGTLLLKEDGAYTEAIRLGIDVDITVSGPTLRARVTQAFRNPTKDWVEATYVYPLPTGGAVDTLKMVVGDRVIIGDIKERQQARVIYEQARRAGQKAALTEQERPNIFTNSVANIGPGETVLVQIEYQEPVHQSGNEYSLRLPLVVGPRYNPAPIVQSVDFRTDGSGWGATNSEPVPDRDRISPPVLDPARNAPVNPTSITVRLKAGFALGEVRSHHHNVKVESPDNATRIVTLADGAVAADRDFELTWKPAAEKAPSVGLFRERVGDADYLLAFVTPPSAEQTTQKPLPREVVFVIDNSGSMGGTSIVQAKASLLYALGRLQPNDRFNVIRFDDTMDVLFSTSVPADPAHLGEALGFVNGLQARGGTEMVPAMRAALTDKAGDTSMVRQVVFLTDGAIGNEQHLFETITAMRGRSRVFMVGIGSAPNTYLMTRAAELGRGAFTHIGSVEQVEERMRGLFAKLENPAVTGAQRKVLRCQGRRDACDHSRRLSRRTAGAGGKARQARRLARDQGTCRRPPVVGDAAAAKRRRRQGPVKTLGQAQDRRCRGGAYHARDDARRLRQGDPRAGARPSDRHAAHQPRRGRQDAEPPRGRAAQAQRATAQPAGRLGFREGFWRATAPDAHTVARTPCGCAQPAGDEAADARRARYDPPTEDRNLGRAQDDRRFHPDRARTDSVRVQPASALAH
ncbi:Ca-activated chloride channel family protein [Bradyrhizobium sp. i1.3.1]